MLTYAPDTPHLRPGFTDAELLGCLPALRRYARVLVRYDADDLVQNVVERALARRAAYVYSGVGLRPWLFVIAHNLAVNRIRRMVRRARIEVELTPRVADIVAAVSEPSSGLIVRDVARGLDQLPVDTRALILDVAAGEGNHAELSARYGVSIGTIYSRLSRGRATLRAWTL